MSHRRGSFVALAVVIAGLASMSACGESPNGPTPPPPPPPVTNTPPVIDSVTPSVTRTEVDKDVTVTATVRDTETAVSQLTYTWSADVGTFSGSGSTVTWKVAKGIATPADVTIKLTVTENYGSGQQNTVSSTSSVIRVHDSPTEIGAMSVTFLEDFANSSVSTSSCLRNFSDSCPGKKEEKENVDFNRDHYQILNSSLKLREVRVSSSGNSGDSRVACAFSSRRTKCDATEVGCKVGAVEDVSGDCTLTAVYEQNRWWLCDSHFLPNRNLSPSFRSFLNAPRP